MISRETKTEINVLTKVIIYGSILLVVFSAVIIGIRYYAAPASVETDTKVFHESQAYNDGIAKEIDDYRIAYSAVGVTQEQKDAIKAALIHQINGYDISRLTPDQRAFIRQIRGF